MPRPADLVILGWLALQVALPLSYYLGSDPHDERFAWRMFSTVRLTRCEVAVSERRGGVDHRLRLRAEIHESWISQLERGQPRLGELFARERCRDPAVEGLLIERRCRAPDRRALAPELRWAACER